MGQETISKTVSLTSNGVRRRLCALSIRKDGDAAAVAGDSIVDQDGECSSHNSSNQFHSKRLLYVDM